MIFNLSIVSVLLTISSSIAWDNYGYGTYYGGVNQGGWGPGSCHQTYLPPGFWGISISDSTFADGWICGACLEGCITLPQGGERCFKGLIDNRCGTCPGKYDLDFGVYGDGRYDIGWSFIKCPDNEPRMSVGKDATRYWARILIEGVGPVNMVEVNDKPARRADGGGWSINDGGGNLGCGPKVKMFLADGRILTRCMDGWQFGGNCPANGPSCYRRRLEGVHEDDEEQYVLETEEEHLELEKVHAYYVNNPNNIHRSSDEVTVDAMEGELLN